jgi:predicted Zn-dependent protease
MTQAGTEWFRVQRADKSGIEGRQNGKESRPMSTHARVQPSKKFIAALVLLGLVALPSHVFGAEKLKFKTGFNLFSAQQDVKMGQEAAVDADKQLPLVTDPEVVRYVNELGRRLASFAPNNKPEYAWAFKVVNSADINAFALPGGFIYVNRGAIEAAQSEAEIAGVIAHEAGHVVMRHGTHQATQVLLAQAPLAILGGLLGESSGLTAQLAEMGISFGVNSLLLKNSRSAESQADEVGTYILYHAGYAPQAMAQFFEIIGHKYPQRTAQFFSDHPNPENRVKDVEALIPQLGPPKDGKKDSPEFQAIKKRLLAMPAPPKGAPAPG